MYVQVVENVQNIIVLLNSWSNYGIAELGRCDVKTLCLLHGACKKNVVTMSKFF